jgi:hypothetical protein
LPPDKKRPLDADAVVTFAPELMLMPTAPNPANEQAFTEAA